MIRVGADARSTVRELMDGFSVLREQDDKNTAILYGRHFEYLDAALKGIGYRTRAPVPSAAIDHYSHDAESELIQELEWHVVDKAHRGSSRADMLEVAAAYCWSRLNPDGMAAQQIRRAMVGRPFAGVWEIPIAFAPPAKDPARDEYLHRYFPLRLEIDSAQQSAWLEEGGRVNVAVRMVRKPLVQVLVDYDKKPRLARNPAQILEQDYPEFRTGFGLGRDEEMGLTRGFATIYHLDDGEHICDYVEMPGYAETYGSRWHTLSNREDGEPWVNPIGRPLFRFACGWLNMDAVRPEDRYSAFIRPLILQRWNIDLGKSILASRTATLPKVVQEIPDAMLNMLADLPSPAEKSAFMDSVAMREHQQVLQVWGKATQLDDPVPSTLAAQLEIDLREYEALKPRQAPDDQTVRNATASSLALAVEQKEARYGIPKGNYAALVKGLVEDCFAMYRASDNSYVFNTKSNTSPNRLYGITSEEVRGSSKSIAAGRQVAVGPEELGEDDSWYTMAVQPIDNSPQARAMRRAEAYERRGHGDILDEEYYSLLGVANVSEHMKELEVQERMALTKEPQMAIDFAAAVQYQAAMHGVDESAIIQAANGMPIPNAQGQAVAAPSTNGNMPGVTVNAPNTGLNQEQQVVV